MPRLGIADIATTQIAAHRATTRARHAVTARNLDILKAQHQTGEACADFQYKPIVSEDFLKEWLDFPIGKSSVLLSVLLLPLYWMIWTNKSMCGLEASNGSIRERICNSISVLGTAAGLFLVIAVQGLLQPPEAANGFEETLVDIFGILMFCSSMSLTMYIGVALTTIYPLMQSLRDDVAFDAFENYKKRWGGYELYLFNMGFQFLCAAYLVAAVILYSPYAVWTMLAFLLLVYGFVLLLSQQGYLALDPISSMHLGLSNDPNDIYRAELMSRYVLKKVPNSILGQNVFADHAAAGGQEPDGGYACQAPALGEPAAAAVAQEETVKVSGSLKNQLHKLADHHQQHHQHVLLNRSLPALEDMFFSEDSPLLQGPSALPAAAAKVAYSQLLAADCSTSAMLLAYLDESKQHTACYRNCCQTMHSHGPPPQHEESTFSSALPVDTVHFRKSFAKQPPGQQDYSSTKLSSIMPETVIEQPSHAAAASFDDLHSVGCPERKAGCWQDALFKLLDGKVSALNCCRIVCFLRPFLR